MSAEKKKDAVRGDIAAVLGDIRHGDLMYDMTEELGKLIAAVRETQKGGTLTLKLKVQPLNKGDGTVVGIIDELSITPPKKEKNKTIFYTTDNNMLQREDPRQMKFNFDNKPANAASGE